MNKKTIVIKTIKVLACVLLGTIIGIFNYTFVNAYEEIVVVIDPGHGGPVENAEGDANSGARYHDLFEKDINLITAKAFKDELEQYGNVRVYLTRDEDVELSLDSRVDFAKSVNANVLISVHYNASADHNFFGSEIFTSAFGECYATGHGLASCIMKEWVGYGNTEKAIKTRIGNKGTDYYGIIRHGAEVNLPTIILEHGYVDNDRDYLRLNNELAWRQMGILDAKGVAAYYGLEKDTVKADVSPTVVVDVPNDPVMPDNTEPTGVRLEINSYDSNKGDVEFTIYAYDDESKLMYYGFLTKEASEDDVFTELELWNGENGKMTGTYHVTPGYEGPLTATVFNVYQVDSKSKPVSLKASKDEMNSNVEEALVDEVSEETDGSRVDIDTVGNDFEDLDNNTEDKSIDDNKESIELGYRENDRTSIKVEEIESSVDNAYNKLIIAGIVFCVIFIVLLVTVVYKSVAKAKRRNARKNRERTSYSWIDDED